MPEPITLPKELKAEEGLSTSLRLPIHEQASMSTVALDLPRWIPSRAVPVRLFVISRADFVLPSEETGLAAETWKREAVDATIVRQRLAAASQELRSAIEAEPVEDGVKHRGEGIIRASLLQNVAEAAAWIRWLIIGESNPAFASAVLKCLER